MWPLLQLYIYTALPSHTARHRRGSHFIHHETTAVDDAGRRALGYGKLSQWEHMKRRRAFDVSFDLAALLKNMQEVTSKIIFYLYSML